MEKVENQVESTMKIKITCPHCQAKYQILEEKIPEYGKSIPCHKCDGAILFMRSDEFYQNNHSPKLSTYILYRKSKRMVADLKFDVDRIKHFEKWLQKQDLTLENATEDTIALFYAHIENEGDTSKVAGFRLTLDALYDTEQKNSLPSPFNPSHLTDAEAHNNFSPEVAAFYLYQKEQGDLDRFDFDLKRIKALMMFLHHHDKEVKSTTSEDLAAFQGMLHPNFSLLQSQGFIVTFNKFFEALRKTGMVSSNPVSEEMEGEVKQHSLETLLNHMASGNLGQPQPLPTPPKQGKPWRLLVGVSLMVALIVAFGLGGVFYWKYKDFQESNNQLIADLAQKSQTIEEERRQRKSAENKQVALEKKQVALKITLLEMEENLEKSRLQANEYRDLAQFNQQLDLKRFHLFQQLQHLSEKAIKKRGRFDVGVFLDEPVAIKTPPKSILPPIQEADSSKNAKTEQQIIHRQKPGEKCVLGDCINGEGTLIFADGSKYVGLFKNGQQHGQGTLFHTNGNKSQGQWKKGKKERVAKVIDFSSFLSEKKKVSEQKKDNHKKSKSDLNKLAKLQQASGSGCLEGDCEDGTGTYLYTSGDIYLGKWRKGKKHGFGTFRFKRGDSYQGEWYNDVKHGQGTYTFKKGQKYSGGWKNGKKEGRGTIYFTNGKKIQGVWKKGIKVRAY